MATEDKRGDPRMPFVLRVNFRDRGDCLDATENLSRGGLFVQTAERFTVGQRLELTVGFPGLLAPVALGGEVVWVRPAREDISGGVGIRVADEADRRRLDEVLGGRASRAVSTPEGGFRVLLVEDNPLVVEMYSYVLKKLATAELRGKVPLEVHFAADGHAALQALGEDTFHLVLTDLYMPVMDGFALLQKMKKDARLRDIPVIAISGGGREAESRARAEGVEVYLRKPVRFAEVLETVKRLLRIS
ncbi:MAG TPA: TIGR02266 family protein [Myxococcaceae bacterium]|nr:TIGR02266 family protein [Myxococcaceae bacterium]